MLSQFGRSRQNLSLPLYPGPPSWGGGMGREERPCPLTASPIPQRALHLTSPPDLRPSPCPLVNLTTRRCWHATGHSLSELNWISLKVKISKKMHFLCLYFIDFIF